MTVALYRHQMTTIRQNKPITMKQHALSSILNPTSQSPSPEPQSITHDQEQNVLRSETISAFHHALDDGGVEEDDDLLVLREKTKDEVDREEEAYQAFLEREVGEDIKGLVTVEPDHDAIQPDEGSEEGGSKEPTPKGKKRKRKKGEMEREETDQEFLMK